MTPRPSWLYTAIATVSWPFLHALYRLDARGIENVPAEGGFVLAANHVSNFDPWPLGVPLWPRRFLRFMAKSELYWFPLSTVLNGAGGFPVRRGEADREALATAVALAQDGHVVAMFPEGTRQKKGLRKKHEARPRTGAARIALDAGVPIVPAAVKGTDGLARLAKLRVAYGEPIQPEGSPADLTRRVMGEIERLHATL